MMRILANTALSLIANAVGLLVGAVVLDGMSLNAGGFLIAVGIFTLVMAVTQPFLVSLSIKHARTLASSSALIAVLVSLVITTMVSAGLEIDGMATWVLASVIVWAMSLIGALLLPLFLFKQVLGNDRVRS